MTQSVTEWVEPRTGLCAVAGYIGDLLPAHVPDDRISPALEEAVERRGPDRAVCVGGQRNNNACLGGRAGRNRAKPPAVPPREPAAERADPQPAERVVAQSADTQARQPVVFAVGGEMHAVEAGEAVAGADPEPCVSCLGEGGDRV